MTEERKRTEIYPSEFGDFFKSMVKEMKRHRKTKGDSWKQDTIIVGNMYPTHSNYNEGHGIQKTLPMVEYLYNLLEILFLTQLWP